MADQPQYLTPEGVKQLEQELDELRTHRRKAVADLINDSKELGTSLNNAEYDEAKREQSFIEGRIQELEQVLHHAKVVQHGVAGTVSLGSRVVAKTADGEEEHFTLVGHAESNPLDGKISNESPVGQALMGRRVGDVVQVKVPAGVLTYTIISVE